MGQKNRYPRRQKMNFSPCWNNFSDFLNMGGYALYVWGAFGATALGMVAEVILLKLKSRKTLEKIKVFHLSDS